MRPPSGTSCLKAPSRGPLCPGGRDRGGLRPVFSKLLHLPGSAGLYLEDLYVRPEHRGKGYGKAFFRRLAAIAAERDCGRLEWWCLDWNTPSIGFYKSLGAETMEDWTVYRLTGPALQRLAEPESPVAETDEI